MALMVPLGFWMVALACLSPSATAAAMFSFGDIAGSAGAMTGFFQMGGGVVTSIAATALFSDALIGLATLMPALAALTISLAAADFWRQRKKPQLG
jgi:DHA1 family bicyclomycin/chloramphenicol resistance-like MFS transporter